MHDVINRILRRVVESDAGCWEFQGSRLARGYGRVGWKGRLWLTHRITYIYFISEIPEGLEIDHLCKNPPCCNPWHLEPVTRSVNIRRGTQWLHVVERETAKSHCPEGHPYNETNTYVTAEGHRQCRKCKAEAKRRYYLRHRERICARQRQRRAEGATA